MQEYSYLSCVYSGIQRYGSDLSVSAFLCRCTNDKCDPDTGECLDGETCIDGQPYNKGVGWRGDSCQTGQYFPDIQIQDIMGAIVTYRYIIITIGDFFVRPN